MDSINRRELLKLTAALPLAFDSKAIHAAEVSQTHRNSRTEAGTFNELPIGAVRPEGWLLTQLQKQAAGVTSHLQHLYAPFTSNAWLSDEPDPKGSWWPWEVRGYWCDGTLRCGLLLQNQQLIDEASQLIKYTFSHPAGDGYLGPSFLREAGDSNRWPHAVFFRAAMAWHDATRDPSIVPALQRHYLESKFNYIADRATCLHRVRQPRRIVNSRLCIVFRRAQVSCIGPPDSGLQCANMTTAPPDVTLRRATSDDASALAALGAATFTETFGHLYPPEDLEIFLTGSHSADAWLRTLADSQRAVWFASLADSTPIGFIAVGACKLPVENREPNAGEIQQLYVLARHHNLRLGSRLMDLGLQWLDAQGRTPLYIGVWSENFGAQRFYGRYGFNKVGEYGFPVGSTVDREFILKR